MSIQLLQKDSLDQYLKSTMLIDFESSEVMVLTAKLGLTLTDKITAIGIAYEYVRDKIPHTFDINGTEVARTASDVIKNGHGICYAKAHLLTALLRSIGMPAGICFQRLCLNLPDPSLLQKPQDTRLVLHAVNAVFIDTLGQWIRLDARGNTNGIQAEFSLDQEQLAFAIHEEFYEEDGLVIYSESPECVARALSVSQTGEALKNNLPSFVPAGD